MLPPLDILKSHVPVDQLRPLSSSDRGDVLWFATPGGQPALGLWKRIRQLVDHSGRWPVILGDAEEIASFADALAINPQPVGETLEYASRLDFDRWVTERATLDFEGDASEFEGDWPAHDVEAPSIITPFDIVSREPLDRVAIALVPTKVSWEAPAFLKFGSWNDCPEPAAHCAAFRVWHERFGAEIVALTHDVIEAQVARPPETRNAAMRLAHQQFGYCTDIVTQGTNTIAELAAGLLNGDAWFFWWD